MELHQLTAHIYYSDAVSQGDRPILGLVAGKNDSIAVDCGNGDSHALLFREAAQRLAVPPLRWGCITHWHWDHVFGGAALGLPLIAQRGTAGQLEAMQDLSWTNEALAARVAEGSEIPFCQEHIAIEHPQSDRRIRIPTPQIIFDQSLTLDLGGVTVKLLHQPSDHSGDGVLVYIPEDKVVFTGDSTYLNMYTSPWHYTGEKLLPLLDTLTGLDADWYLCAHHDKVQSRQEFFAFARYQRTLCAMVGDRTTAQGLPEAFAKEFGAPPTPQQLEDLMAFVRGNLVKTR